MVVGSLVDQGFDPGVHQLLGRPLLKLDSTEHLLNIIDVRQSLIQGAHLIVRILKLSVSLTLDIHFHKSVELGEDLNVIFVVFFIVEGNVELIKLLHIFLNTMKILGLRVLLGN